MYIDAPTAFKKMIIPEMSYTPMKEWHKEYLDTVYKVVDKVEGRKLDLPKYDKIYFSRSAFSRNSKTDYGEEEIVSLLRGNGFHIVYPEEHSVTEQIFLVNHCKIFASICGSLAHNIVFAKTKPKTILFKRMNGYQWHQWMLNEMAGVDPITYVDAYNEPYKLFFDTTISGPYLYTLNQNVKRFAKENGMILGRTNFFSHISVFVRYTFRVIRCILSNLKQKISKKKRK